MITFELHLTTTFLDYTEITRFEKFCQRIEVKPIIIQLPEGQYRQQPMISKILRADSEQNLLDKIKLLEEAFTKNKFEISRTKIEIPIWEKPKTTNFFIYQTQKYYEWHGKVHIEQAELIQNIIQKYSGKLSRNSLKKDTYSKFITLRDYAESEISIVNKIDNLKAELTKNGIDLIKEELEFCIFDSNENLDKDWIL